MPLGMIIYVRILFHPGIEGTCPNNQARPDEVIGPVRELSLASIVNGSLKRDRDSEYEGRTRSGVF